MPRLHLATPSEAAFDAGFERIRHQFDVVVEFAPDVLAEAESAVAGGERADRRHLEFITIDPAGSRDLDQAFTARRIGDGFEVQYAIADVGSFIHAEGALDLATRDRGLTFYAPDRNAPLHPDVMSSGTASILPDRDTPALLWTIQLDHEGRIVDAAIERAVVRSRRALSYHEVTADLATDDPDERHVLLREIGLLRLALERERGGVSLNLPSQEVVEEGDHYVIEYRATLPVEEWNAQISLMTGMAAAQIMLDGGLGILRTLAPPDPATIEWLRRTSNALSVSYPKHMSYGEWVRSLGTDTPVRAALQHLAGRAFRSAGYAAFSGEPPADPNHAALATPYSHVTAPLRRLIDRYTNEIVLALCTGRRPEGWALAMLETIPELMTAAYRRSKQFEQALVDFAEVMMLSGRVGDRFEAIVTDRRDDRVTLQLFEPAVIVRLRHRRLDLGDVVTIELTTADVASRRLDFTVV